MHAHYLIDLIKYIEHLIKNIDVWKNPLFPKPPNLSYLTKSQEKVVAPMKHF